MLVVICDGYNVIHAIPELARELDRNLLAARNALLAMCRAWRASRGDVRHLYVVFDGDEDLGFVGRQELPGVTVLFTTRREEADERILSLLRRDQGRDAFVIVSNDTYVFNNARAHGARVMSVSEFYAQTKRTNRRHPRPDASGKAPLTSGEARRITEEYRRHLEGG